MAQARQRVFGIVGALLLAAHGGVAAQAPAPAATSAATPATLAPGQVSGAELQAWFDAEGMPIAGINLRNQCYFLARGANDARRQYIDCPGMATFVVVGEGKVVGDQLCSKFSYPDGSRIDRCQDVFKVGDNRYELRVQGAVMTVFSRLLR